MNKIILGLFVTIIVVSSCLKTSDTCERTDSTVTAPASQVTDVQNYLTANSITATPHASGFFYSITTTGSGTSIANLCTSLAVKYVGKLTNGNIFDQTAVGTTATFVLWQVIVGWQKALPMISKGGKIKLYIPPALGYGATPVTDGTGAVVIPANSILIFDVELIEISNL